MSITVNPIGPPFDYVGAGAVGPTGPPGATGPPGPRGLPGDVGAASQVPGPPGAAGAAGAAGAPGTAGVAGGLGPRGLPGDPGPPSLIPGPPGAAGAAGAAGATGATGATGSVGPRGLPGDLGLPSMIPGPVGPTGAAGAAGSTGATGVAGSVGPRGLPGDDAPRHIIPGPAGPQGAVGPMGPPAVLTLAASADTTLLLSRPPGNVDNGLYFLLAGRPVGQVGYGSTAAAGTLTLHANPVDRTSLIELDDTTRFGASLPTAAVLDFAKIDRTLTVSTAAAVVQGMNISPTLTFTGGSATMRYNRIGGTVSRNWGPGAGEFLAGLYIDYESTAASNLPWLADTIFDLSLRTLTAGTVTNTTGGPNPPNTGQIDLSLTLQPTLRVTGASASLTLGGGFGGLYWQPRLTASGNSSVLTVDRVSALWDNGALVTQSGSPAGIVTMTKHSTVYASDNLRTSAARYAVIDSEVSTNSGKNHVLFATGTASSRHAGPMRVGDSGTEPSDAFEVVGNLNVITGFIKLNTLAQTFSSATTLLGYTSGDTITGVGTALNIFSATGTIDCQSGPSFTGLFMNVTYSRSTAGVGLVTYAGVSSVPVYINTMSTNITTGNSTGLSHQPSYSVTSTGTIAGVNDNTVSSDITIGNLCTVATRKGVNFNDATLTGNGALTLQIGADYAALTKAANNLAIRAQAAIIQTYLVGACTIPTGYFSTFAKTVKLTGTTRMTIQGTGRLRVS